MARDESGYTYDGAGNLVTMIDGRAKQTLYAYDAAGLAELVSAVKAL